MYPCQVKTAPLPDGETSSAEVPSHQAPGCTSERGSKSMHWTVPTFRLQQEVEVQEPGCPIFCSSPCEVLLVADRKGPADEVLCSWCRGCSHDAFQCARFLAAGPAHSKVPAGGGRQIGAGGLPEAAGGEKAAAQRAWDEAQKSNDKADKTEAEALQMGSFASEQMMEVWRTNFKRFFMFLRVYSLCVHCMALRSGSFRHVETSVDMRRLDCGNPWKSYLDTF